MLIASFEEWRAERQRVLSEENPMLECANCDGDGEIIEDCPCCGHEKEDECPVCEGEGQVPFHDAAHGLQTDQVTVAEYFKQVVTDLKKWCAFTREDYLAVSGRFVNEFRSKGWR